MARVEASGEDLINYVMDSLRRGSATRLFDLADFELVNTPELDPKALRQAWSKLSSETGLQDSMQPNRCEG